MGTGSGKPRLLELFCKAGGSGKGYADAGFEVVGVDIEPQPNYPFEFHQDDALTVLHWLNDLLAGDPRDTGWPHDWSLGGFAAIHASPPCQAESALKGLTTKDYPRLIEPVRELLQQTGLPYVIENVVGAPLVNPIRLCGSSFDGLEVWRHRLFECNFPVMALPCRHWAVPEPIDVTGTGGPSSKPRLSSNGGLSRKPRNLEEARRAMGIDWMNRAELSEAIPPAMTEHIGSYLLTEIRARAARESAHA